MKKIDQITLRLPIVLLVSIKIVNRINLTVFLHTVHTIVRFHHLTSKDIFCQDSVCMHKIDCAQHGQLDLFTSNQKYRDRSIRQFSCYSVTLDTVLTAPTCNAAVSPSTIVHASLILLPLK